MKFTFLKKGKKHNMLFIIDICFQKSKQIICRVYRIFKFILHFGSGSLNIHKLVSKVSFFIKSFFNNVHYPQSYAVLVL
jgi:hypothetical protein